MWRQNTPRKPNPRAARNSYEQNKTKCLGTIARYSGTAHHVKNTRNVVELTFKKKNTSE